MDPIQPFKSVVKKKQRELKTDWFTLPGPGTKINIDTKKKWVESTFLSTHKIYITKNRLEILVSSELAGKS